MLPAAGPQGLKTPFWVDENTDADLDPFVPIMNFMDELDLFCQDWTPRDLSHMTAQILSLQAEMCEKEVLCSRLILRTNRLVGKNLETTLKKIGELRLFLHFGHLSLLKYHSFLEDRYKDAIRHPEAVTNMRRSSQNPPPR